MPEEIVRALVGGITTTMRRRLARDREGDLQALVPELLDWALGYRPPPQRLRSPRAAAPAKSARSEPGGQEQRLLAALAGALVEDGYAGTTITGVARRAGVSLTTFYAFFENKHEALLAVLDYVREASAAAVADGWDDSESWPEGVRAALDSLFHTFDDRPVLARVGALEPGLDDPRVRDHGIETLALEAVLAPGRHDAPVVQRTSAEAIGGGILALIDRQARNRQRHPLRALTPVATYVALAPFVGSGEACLVANGP
jgi:AcrR family transcriptional regulator